TLGVFRGTLLSAIGSPLTAGPAAASPRCTQGGKRSQGRLARPQAPDRFPATWPSGPIVAQSLPSVRQFAQTAPGCEPLPGSYMPPTPNLRSHTRQALRRAVASGFRPSLTPSSTASY